MCVLGHKHEAGDTQTVAAGEAQVKVLEPDVQREAWCLAHGTCAFGQERTLQGLFVHGSPGAVAQGQVQVGQQEQSARESGSGAVFDSML